ncbi:hypothetical protein DFO47_102580 [Arthrobacter sp. AG258]|uniref:hypothetical protein n=1 Tax=Arthrobacter sp. AG258 TaxID=2183899 RepID=UPI00105C023F|nr:hypothetical protein [Arthrobacter sp. AG258]TDT82646.1 hypothetical protein DFO47_102580 [Arthrobacter sp. AG258]
MLENTARPSQPPPPAAHRRVRQADLPAEQLSALEPVPKGRLAGCVLALLLGGWMLAVPVVLIDRLKDSPGTTAGVLSVVVVACAVVTAGLGGFRFFNPRDERKPLRLSLSAALTASIAAGAASALVPEYGVLLVIPAVFAGIPALGLLVRDARAG